jgi:2-methylcitrate dehydratase PrpD
MRTPLLSTYTEQVAEYVAATTYDALPASTVAATKRVTLDLLGVVLPAINYGPGSVMNQYIRETGGAGRATVVGTDIKTTAANAALANGTMAADMEQDDVHPESNLHASSVFVPAMLGVAEELDSSGRDWINALAVAYDVGCRLSIAMDNGRQYASGFHPTAVSGTFGATSAVARLLGLDAAGVNSAIGLAGCQAAGMLTWEMETEHYTKSFQSGVPARNAVVAGQLAARGYIGASNTLDGKYNVFDAFSNHRNFPRLVENLGERHEVEYTGYKFYSVCRFIHSALDQLLDLSEEHGFAGSDIEGLDVWLPHTQVPIVDHNTLITHNLQYSLAVGITDRIVERAQTSNERFADPALQAIAAKVTLRGADDMEALYPAHWPSRVHIRLTDGRTFESERHDPRGTSFVPVTDADMVAKFEGMASQVLPAERVNQIVKVVDELETLDSIRELTALLVP